SCSQESWSSFTACFHFPRSSSMEIDTTSSPLALNLLCISTSLGFCSRQGLHQLAQKSTSTYLPLKSERLNFLPFTSSSVKPGAALPKLSLISTEAPVFCSIMYLTVWVFRTLGP